LSGDEGRLEFTLADDASNFLIEGRASGSQGIGNVEDTHLVWPTAIGSQEVFAR